MLKGGILGIFCWICLFSECFLSIRDVVWLWAFACRKVVDFVCRKVVGFCLQDGCGLCLQKGCGLCLQDGVGFLLVGWLWALLVGWLWALLVLESFLRDLVCWRVNIDCSDRESSLLGQRKQLPGIDYNDCLDRWSEDFLM